ncbi:MAG TPA: hypothetical protein VFH91_09625 [Pyrinomonadaceae bacterium]|nr:hypothetical protein [Pyrinomonadaceae bacterium]
MTYFNLVSAEGENLQVIDWLWNPTLQLLFSADAITQEDHLRLLTQGFGAQVDAAKATLIGDIVAQKVGGANPGRMQTDRLVTSESEVLAAFGPNTEITYKWLRMFAKFCQSSGGFEVV